MYAITGITGKVGSALANALLDAGLPVRAVLRDATKAGDWTARGCEVAVGEMDDAESLRAAFMGTQGDHTTQQSRSVAPDSTAQAQCIFVRVH